VRRIALLLAFFSTVAQSAQSSHVHADFPTQIDPQARYVVYSHGRIVEGNDETPVSPEFGRYDFPGIRAALTRNGDFELIARHRPKDANGTTEAQHLEEGVRRLVAAGVKPSRITLVGFSKGSYITALASSHLADLHIHTALMAACLDGLPSREPMRLVGNVLSVYETSDDAGSCRGLKDLGGAQIHFEEVDLSTGLRHGAFFRPIEAWVAPLLAWISRTNR
jgi:predicted esterase